MKLRFSALVAGLLGLLFSCNSNAKFSKNNFEFRISTENKKIQAKDTLKLSVQGTVPVDSIHYFYAGELLVKTADDMPVSVQLDTYKLGRNPLTALLFSDKDTLSLKKNITLHSSTPPVLYTYKIVNSFPHDPKAFTQGLEFYKDTLYEGTGLYGFSELRKVDLESGEVLQTTKLDKEYFGEGLTILNDKVYQLTWRENKGFIYDAASLKEIKTFNYGKSKEGWGLCNDGKYLYKSDGTDKIWILDPENMEELSYIQPVTSTSLATKVNELEWVEGKIYANTWQKEGVLIINPENGEVEGVIDFRGLRDKQNNKKADVLNGIAYHPLHKKLYVTGKYWDKVFEVEIVEK